MSLQEQACTFYLEDRMYALDVQQVQEVTKSLPITPIPLAPSYVKGLINLRGQIAVSIDLREMFGLPKQENTELTNTIVCRTDGILMAFPVDRVGDVVENDYNNFENTPETVEPKIAQFMKGVFKSQHNILSMLDIESILKCLDLNGKALASEA
ncbi:chemotaxis protein CheW [Pseudobdellovibrio sp. HCB154]|uniref:chemotaxis protein CheW n=1 Tax=Pseudobdellovibrio sp. HCB154 TaxID=3386277 RepID=UPI003916D9E2